MIKGKHHFVRRGSFDNLHRDYFLVNSQIGAYPKYLSHLWGFRCVYLVNKKTKEDRRGLLGSSWYNSSMDSFGSFRAAYLSKYNPSLGGNYLGFRCVYPKNS